MPNQSLIVTNSRTRDHPSFSQKYIHETNTISLTGIQIRNQTKIYVIQELSYKTKYLVINNPFFLARNSHMPQMDSYKGIITCKENVS